MGIGNRVGTRNGFGVAIRNFWGRLMLIGAQAPETHDFSVRGWGHDYVIHKVKHEGRVLEVSGWTRGIKKGDYLIMKNGERTTRYRTAQIEYCSDPSDMFFATLEFAPRYTR